MGQKALYDLTLNISANSAELKKGLEQANLKLSSFEKNVGTIGTQIISAFAKVGGAIMALKGAFDFVKDALQSTGKSADKFAENVEGVKQGFEAFKRAVATLDFTDFIKNVKAAIDEGRRYARSLDELDEKSRALKIAEADASNEILKQKIIQNSALSTSDQKIKAGERIIELEKQLQELRVGLAQQAYDNEIENIASITHLTIAETDAYLKGEKAIRDKIAAADEYNKNVNELDKLKVITLQGIKLTEEQSARYKVLTENIKNASDETKTYAFAAKNMSDDPKLNLAVQKYVELQEARRSADENTLRVQTKLNNEYEKTIDNTEKIVKSTQKLVEVTNQRETPSKLQGNNILPTPKIDTTTLATPVYNTFKTGWVDALTVVNENVQNVIGGFNALGSAISQASEDGKTSFKEAMSIMSAAALATIPILQGLAIAGMISKESMKGLVGIATAIAGIALIVGLFAKNKPKANSFATGTSFAPGGLSLVGERGPELVNIPRGSQVYTASQTANMLGSNKQLVARVAGRDLLFIVEEAQRVKNNSY